MVQRTEGNFGTAFKSMGSRSTGTLDRLILGGDGSAAFLVVFNVKLA